jgi:cysteine synthase
VVEWTGGSTGSSLAMVCAIKGYRFTPISSDGFSDEKLRTMRLFGGDLEIFPAEGGKLVPELYQRMKDVRKNWHSSQARSTQINSTMRMLFELTWESARN